MALIMEAPLCKSLWSSAAEGWQPEWSRAAARRLSKASGAEYLSEESKMSQISRVLIMEDILQEGGRGWEPLVSCSIE